MEIRRFYDRLVSTMGFPIHVRWHSLHWIWALLFHEKGFQWLIAAWRNDTKWFHNSSNQIVPPFYLINIWHGQQFSKHINPCRLQSLFHQFDCSHTLCSLAQEYELLQRIGARRLLTSHDHSRLAQLKPNHAVSQPVSHQLIEAETNRWFNARKDGVQD